MARYEGLRKADRNKAVIRCYLAHPDWSQAEIGKAFNTSKQNVGRILKRWLAEYK